MRIRLGSVATSELVEKHLAEAGMLLLLRVSGELGRLAAHAVPPLVVLLLIVQDAVEWKRAFSIGRTIIPGQSV